VDHMQKRPRAYRYMDCTAWLSLCYELFGSECPLKNRASFLTLDAETGFSKFKEPEPFKSPKKNIDERMRSHNGYNYLVSPLLSRLTIPLKWQEFGGNIKIHYSFLYICKLTCVCGNLGTPSLRFIIEMARKAAKTHQVQFKIKANLARSRRWPTPEPRSLGPVLRGLGAPQGLDETTCFWKATSIGTCPGANKI
jgi:hypothetical protein